MPKTVLSPYCAYALDDRTHGHVVEAASFAEAALQFIEVWHPHPDDEEVRVVVLDQVTGDQQCFVIELAGDEPSAEARRAAC